MTFVYYLLITIGIHAWGKQPSGFPLEKLANLIYPALTHSRGEKGLINVFPKSRYVKVKAID